MSLVGFLAAMVLVIVAERLGRPNVEPLTENPAPLNVAARCTLVTGLAACAAAGASVWVGGGRVVSHVVWTAGLLLLAASAIVARRQKEVQGSGAETAPRRRDRRLWAGGAAIGAVAALLFFVSIATVPPEVHGDEAEVGNDAIGLLEGEFNLFTTGWYGLPTFHAFPTAVAIEIAGVNLRGLRGASATLGVLAVLLTLALARRLWGLQIGVLAALFLASARYFVHLSRVGYHYVDTPAISILAVFFLSSLWYDLSLTAAIWCGITLGLGVQTYFASRLVPVLLTLTVLLWLVRSERRLVAVRVRLFGVVVLTAIATAAPMIGYFSAHPDGLMARTRGVSIFGAEAISHLAHGYRTGDLMQILAIQLKHTLTLFNLTGDTSLQYGYRAGGLLEPLSAAFFVLGLAVLLARPLARPNQLVLLWVALPTIAGAALTIDAPFYPRISGIMPFVALTVAIAVAGVLTAIREALPGSAGRIVAGTAAALIVVTVVATNLWTYFVEYAPTHRHSPAVEISRFIREHGDGKTTYMIGGAPAFFIKHGTIRFLAHGYDTRDVVDLEVYARQHSLDPARSIFVVMPRGQERALLARLERLVGPLDVRAYHTTRDAVEFYGAVPKAGSR
jgi:hypothetical protein